MRQTSKQAIIFTAHKRSFRRLCLYTCLSVILFTGGACTPPCHTPPTMHAPCHAHPPAMHTPVPCTPPLPRTPHPCHACPQPLPCMSPAMHAPTKDITTCGQWAGGTHPTGIHSCLMSIFHHSKTVNKQLCACALEWIIIMGFMTFKWPCHGLLTRKVWIFNDSMNESWHTVLKPASIVYV